jgi:protein SCO1
MRRSAGLFPVPALVIAAIWGSYAGGAFAQDDSGMHEHHHTVPGTTRSVANYTIPRIQLVRADGAQVSLDAELDDGRPVFLTFIYTTCTTVCPLVSQTFARLQSLLGDDRDRVHLVSITIDPEEDTPSRLAAYAKDLKAGPEWQHYTGTIAASIAAQRAFNTYRGDKMDHTPVTLFRSAPGKTWVRIDGFATAQQLLTELRDATSASNMGK